MCCLDIDDIPIGLLASHSDDLINSSEPYVPSEWPHPRECCVRR